LEHVDEMLRSARLSGYLYIRTVAPSPYFHFLFVFGMLCSCKSPTSLIICHIFSLIEMSSIAWRTSSN
ncbi:Dihydropteroate synthase, partial [Actinidia chinensis var. chinensis]